MTITEGDLSGDKCFGLPGSQASLSPLFGGGADHYGCSLAALGSGWGQATVRDGARGLGQLSSLNQQTEWSGGGV